MATNRDQAPLAPERANHPWTGLARVVRPTLIAALGGTGAAAAKAALARIQGLVGPAHHYLATRVFDTTFQDSREPRLVDNTEYVYLGGFNAQSVIADIVYGRAFPHWAQWLPPRLNFQQVAFGAGGIRPIGRLCYFYRRERVEAAIQEAITAITDSDRALRFHQQTGIRVNLEAGIDIHLIASVCGGTGSGMFLDFAFDLRRWAEQHTNREVTVTGHLVLPEAFRGKPVVMKALEANAFTALQEMDRFMNATSNDPWVVEYVQSRPEVSWRAPFDHCYLLSGLQQGGTTDVDTLTAVIGEAISVLALSQAGQKISEGVINMAGQRKSTRDEQGKVCCYSSYGILSLELPEELLGEALGPDLARHLHRRLVHPGGDAESARQEDLQGFRESLGGTDFGRIEAIIPQIEVDVLTVQLIGTNRRQEGAAKNELQRLLTAARASLNQVRRRAGQADLWDVQEMRRHLAERIRGRFGLPGGLALTLQYLEGCINTLSEYQQGLRAKAEEFREEAAKYQDAANTLEQSNLANKELNALLTTDLVSWQAYQRLKVKAEVFDDQPVRIERLIAIVRQEFLTPWSRIKGMLENLHLGDSRDEGSYYRAHRARASVGTVRWFRETLLDRNLARIEEGILEHLTDDVKSWAKLEPKEVNAKFYQVCSEAIHQFFRSEPEMTCDQLLARCYEYPSERYKTAVAVLLDRAKANWEMYESYDMRENKLEISAVGVKVDSPLYETIQEGHRAIQPVDEQREDYFPIFRTEHGLSLAGLKSLSAYRNSLLAAVFEEQRFDFHFFNDRRWITRLEYAAEEKEELERLYVWSIAVRLGLVERAQGKGYLLAYDGKRRIGRYRREAYLSAVQDRELFQMFDQAVQEMKNHEDPQGWRTNLERYIQELEKELDRAADPKQVTSIQYLSLDVYQVHAEIRALKNELRIEDLGL